MYSGGYRSHRHSLLTQIRPANARDLELKWVFQSRSLEKIEVTPLVVNGTMYTIQSPQRRHRAECRHGKADLDVLAHAGPSGEKLLRQAVPRPGHFRRHALSCGI